MQTRKIELQANERVLFESGSTVITNQRLLANWTGRDGGRPKDSVALEDIAGYERVVGGQDSRMDKGLALGAGGTVLILFGLIPGLPSAIENVAFLVGVVGAIFGVHFVLQSMIRLRPHTTLLFEVGAKVIAISFPGRENPDADELARQFNRAKNEH